MLITRDDPAVIHAKTRYSLKIAIFFIHHLHSMPPLIFIVLSRLDKRHTISSEGYVALEKGVKVL